MLTFSLDMFAGEALRLYQVDDVAIEVKRGGYAGHSPAKVKLFRQLWDKK
jgi:hypothetical protein